MGKLMGTIVDGIVNFIKNFSFINLLGGVVFIILICLSLYYNVSLFYQLGSNEAEKYGFVLASLAIEGAKIFFLLKGSLAYVKAKFEIEKSVNKGEVVKKTTRVIKRLPAFVMWFLYAGFSVLSIFASYGYSLTALEKLKVENQTVAQSIMVTDHTQDIEDLNAEVLALLEENKAFTAEKAGIDANIATLIAKDKADYIPQSSYSRKNEIDKLITANKATIEKKKTTIQQYKDKDAKAKTTNTATITVVTARSTFELLGSAFGIKEDQMKFTVMFWIAIMVELGIIALKPQAKIPSYLIETTVPIPVSQPIETKQQEPVITKRTRRPKDKKPKEDSIKASAEDVVVINEPKNFIHKDGSVNFKFSGSSNRVLSVTNEVEKEKLPTDKMTEKEIDDMLKRAHDLSIDVDNEKRNELEEAAKNYV